MLKYKRLKTQTLTDGEETLAQILGGVTGKTRHVVGIGTKAYADMYLRVYKDAEQIVDASSELCTSGAPLLPMDFTLVAGEVCLAGFYNDGAVAEDAKQITIAYEES